MRHLLATAGLVLSLLTAPYLTGITTVVNRPVDVREGPGLGYARIGQIEPDAVLTLLARSGINNNWLRVRTGADADAQEGWIAHFTVQPLDDVSDLPLLPAPIMPEPTATIEQAVHVEVFRSVNVRSGPTITADIITRLRSGDRLHVVGRSDTGNDWLLVNLEGITGWLAYFTVTVVGNPDSLPVIDAQSGQPVTTTRIPEGVQAAAFRTVNVRSGPGADFDSLGQLSSGEVVTVIGRSDMDNNWLQIDFAGQTGWVAYFAVSVSGNLTTLPVME